MNFVDICYNNKIDISDISNMSLQDIENYESFVRIMATKDTIKIKNQIKSQKYKIKYASYYEIIKRNIKFKNIHSGRRCFILGNGPSLNRENISLLRDEIVFTVSNIHRFPFCDDLHIDYHFYADPMFFRKDICDAGFLKLKEQYLNDLAYLTNKKNVNCFISTMGYDEIHTMDMINQENMNYFSSPLYFYDEYDEEFDFTNPIPSFQTVIQWAVACAIFMGIKEIYLLGCDCTNLKTFFDETAEIHAYKTDEADKWVRENARDIQGLESQFSGWGRIFHIYKELYKYCEKRDIKFCNCSKETILESIPRDTLENVINGKQ